MKKSVNGWNWIPAEVTTRRLLGGIDSPLCFGETRQLMWIQGTPIGFHVNIQKSDTQLTLKRLQLTRDNRAIFSTAYFLHVKKQKLTLWGECNKIDWALLNEGGINIAVLGHQPCGSDEFGTFPITGFVIWSHYSLDPPTCYKINYDNTSATRRQIVDTNKWKSVAVSIDIYNILKKRADNNDRSVSKELAHIVKTQEKSAEQVSA